VTVSSYSTEGYRERLTRLGMEVMRERFADFQPDYPGFCPRARPVPERTQVLVRRASAPRLRTLRRPTVSVNGLQVRLANGRRGPCRYCSP
jgi:hypothetical protein